MDKNMNYDNLLKEYLKQKTVDDEMDRISEIITDYKEAIFLYESGEITYDELRYSRVRANWKNYFNNKSARNIVSMTNKHSDVSTLVKISDRELFFYDYKTFPHIDVVTGKDIKVCLDDIDIKYLTDFKDCNSMRQRVLKKVKHKVVK